MSLRLTALAIVKEKYRFARAVCRGELWAIEFGSCRTPLGIGVTEARAWRAAARKISRRRTS